MKTRRKTESSPADVGTQDKPSAAASVDGHQARIAEAAYFLAEQRGFAPGFEMQDWLEAESRLRNGSA